MKYGIRLLIGVILLAVLTACNNFFHELIPSDDNRISEFKVNGDNARIGEDTISILWKPGMTEPFTAHLGVSLPDKASLLPVTEEYIRAAFPSIADPDAVIDRIKDSTPGDAAAYVTELIKQNQDFNVPALNMDINFSGVTLLVISGQGSVRRYTANVVNDVIFDTDGGNNIGPQEVIYGKTASRPSPDPSKTGYTFVNWYTNPGKTTTAVFPITVNNYTTLYAGWTANAYTVTYNKNADDVTGTTANSDHTYNTEKKLTKNNYVRTGYTFDGWNTNASGTGTNYGDEQNVVNLTATAGAAVTLYAKWKPLPYTATFDFLYNGLITTQPVYHGDKIVRPPDPSNLGFAIAGWYKEAGLTNEWDFNTAATGNITLYAKWTPVCTVTFESNGGSAVPGKTVASGGRVPEPSPAPSRTYYTFGGWYKEAGFVTLWNFSTDTVSGPTTLYAKWNIIVYTITYNANGGTGTTPSSQAVNAGTSITLESGSGLSRTGYTFGGWNTNSSGTGTNYGAGSSYSPTVSITLYAKWNPITYTVTYNADGGSPAPASPATVNQGSTVTAPSAMTKTGYDFDGWYTDSAKTILAVFPITVTSSITLYAKWNIKTYTVTYNADGGSPAPTGGTVNYEAVISQPAPMTKIGHTFGGWFTNSGKTTAASFPITVTGNVELYAKWIINTYTVTFNPDNEKPAPAEQQVNYGGKVTKPADPTKSGYTFDGWSEREDVSLPRWDFDSGIVTGVMTLKARWIINWI
jgi:uncharacterized repeat protein (TIGR02543 family)